MSGEEGPEAPMEARPAENRPAVGPGAETGWRGLARGLRDVLFPPSCLHCGDVVERSPLRHVCAACAPLVMAVEPPCCPCCGHPFFGEASGERLCVHCEGLRPEFREGRTAVLFKGPARALVHELKYRRGLFALEDMTALLAGNPHTAGFLRGAALVPVPLHPRKKRERGYNQGEELARALARRLGGGTGVAELLTRVMDTKTQTNLDREKRRANLKNAFALAPGVPINPDLRYVLIDDVFTTGSTLNACAAVLRRAGCLNVDVCTFGHG
jgi:ComF family protein